MRAFANDVLKRIRWGQADASELLGRFLTTPKDNVVFGKNAAPARWHGKTVVLDPKTQMLYAGARFFINGEAFAPRASQRKALAGLADRRQAPGRVLARAGLQELISAWQRAGYLHLR